MEITLAHVPGLTNPKINLLGTKNEPNLALPPVTLPSRRQFGHVYENGEDCHAPVTPSRSRQIETVDISVDVRQKLKIVKKPLDFPKNI